MCMFDVYISDMLVEVPDKKSVMTYLMCMLYMMCMLMCIFDVYV